MKLSENFTVREFACEDGCGFGTNPGDVSRLLLGRLELIRAIRGGRPMYLKSGCRCPTHNKAVGGVDNSGHVRGIAADVGVYSGFDRAEFAAADVLAAAVDAGAMSEADAVAMFATTRDHLGGLGIAKGFVHVDVDTVKPRPGAWSY